MSIFVQIPLRLHDMLFWVPLIIFIPSQHHCTSCSRNMEHSKDVGCVAVNLVCSCCDELVTIEEFCEHINIPLWNCESIFHIRLYISVADVSKDIIIDAKVNANNGSDEQDEIVTVVCRDDNGNLLQVIFSATLPMLWPNDDLEASGPFPSDGGPLALKSKWTVIVKTFLCGANEGDAHEMPVLPMKAVSSSGKVFRFNSNCESERVLNTDNEYVFSFV